MFYLAYRNIEIDGCRGCARKDHEHWVLEPMRGPSTPPRGAGGKAGRKRRAFEIPGVARKKRAA